MENTLVSIVITSHNRCGLLKIAVNSVLKQSYQNIECIIVDDASKDDTQKLFSSRTDLKYIRINIESSKGGNHARNVGIQNASGKYVAFLDDDDEWLPDKIEKQVKLFETNSEVGVVFCGFYICNKSGKIQKKVMPFIKHVDPEIKTKIMYGIVTVTSALMVKKELLQKIGGFDEKLKFWQEYELTIRLAQITLFDFSEDYLMKYLNDPLDKKRLTNKYNDWLEAVEYIHIKHKNLYANLTWFGNCRYKLLILRDAEVRSFNAGLKNKHTLIKCKRLFFHLFIKVVGVFEELFKANV